MERLYIHVCFGSNSTTQEGLSFLFLYSRSPSLDRKRPRWEEDWSETSSGEKSYTAIKDKEPEDTTVEKNEEDDEALLKPVWVRCTHSESYYSNDPMDQVVCLLISSACVLLFSF